LDEIAVANNFPMNSLGISIPYTYCSESVALNWNDILFAIKNNFLPHQSAIEHAISKLENDDYPQIVLDLACLTQKEAVYPHSIHPYIDELANLETEDEKNKTKDKIMYVLLKWVFANRECYEEPLQVVQFIYDDFDFPKQISSFAGYMLTEPDLGLIELNEQRALDNWKTFLDEQDNKYGRLQW